MLRIDWASPKITIKQFEEFLSPYLGSNYDGIIYEDNYIYIRTFDQLTSTQEDYIMNYVYSLINQPREVVPLTPKNDHTSQPWGATKGKFTASDRACVITLSDKSEDGLTFTYSSSLTPRVGDYIFQDDFCKRSWIVSVDTGTNTLTVDDETVKPTLDEGEGVYSQGYWLSVDVPGWSESMYLWGLMLKFYFSGGHDGKNDFIELSIVDSNDIFKSDEYCQAIFGVATAVDAEPYILALGFEDNGEYGHWTKYYDESWVCTSQDKTIMTPDGAPGQLIPHLETRISVFTSKMDSTVTEVFLDYFPTSKD